MQALHRHYASNKVYSLTDQIYSPASRQLLYQSGDSETPESGTYTFLLRDVFGRETTVTRTITFDFPFPVVASGFHEDSGNET